MSERHVSRARWAAIGAAVAVTLGAGGLVGVNAASNESMFTPITPVRMLDTRQVERVGSLVSPQEAEPYRLAISGRRGVPVSGVTGVSLNVTVVQGETNGYGGYVTVYPCESVTSDRTDTSNLNFKTGQTLANPVTTALSSDGYICLFVYGTAHLLVDANGYYSASSATALQGPAGETGPQGEVGPAGDNGALSGLTCGDEEFVAMLEGAWTCARLVRAPGGTFTGTLDFEMICCTIQDWVSAEGFSSVGFQTDSTCDELMCVFAVTGIEDHTTCSIRADIDGISYTEASPDVHVSQYEIVIDGMAWFTFEHLGNRSVDVQCGASIVAANS